MSFDMSNCKVGDKLKCRDGRMAVFKENDGHDMYPYELTVGEIGISVTWDGKFYSGGGEDIKDIIGVWEEEKVMIERDKEYEITVTGEQLAWIYLLTGSTNSINPVIYGRDTNHKTGLYGKAKNLLEKNCLYAMSTGRVPNIFQNSKEICEWLDKVFSEKETPEQKKLKELEASAALINKQIEELKALQQSK